MHLRSFGFATLLVLHVVACSSNEPASTRLGATGADGGADAAADSGGSGGAPECAEPPTFHGPLKTAWTLPLSLSSGEGGIAVAPDGGVIVGGAFVGTFDLHGKRYETGPTGNQAYVAKLDAAGKHVWSNAYFDFPAAVQSVATDAAGEVFVAGYFGGHFDLGTGPLSGGAFLGKLDAEGSTQWAKGFTASNLSVAVGPGGRVALTGTLSAPTDFGGGSIGKSYDTFVAVFDAAGLHVFSRAFQAGVHTAFDAAGSLLIAGGITVPIDLGGGLLQPLGASSAFVAALDTAGHQLWSHVWGDRAEITAIAARLGGGTAITGSFAGALDTGSGPVASVGMRDLFVAWLGSTGDPTKLKTFVASDADRLVDLAVTTAGDVLLTGYVGEAVDVGGGPLWPHGMLLARLDASGQHVLSARFGGPGSPDGRRVQLAADGTAYVFGMYSSGSVDLGDGPLPDGGYGRGFVAAFAPSAVSEPSRPCADPPVVLPDGSNLLTDSSGALAADATNVYWMTRTELLRAPRTGGTPTLLAFGQKLNSGLALVADRLYWSVAGTEAADGAIYAIQTGGGTATQIEPGLASPKTVRADAQRLYWISGSSIQSAPLDGGATTTLASLGGDVALLAIAADALYVVASKTTLSRVPITGGAPTLLATAPRDIVAAASDGQHVYYAVSSSWGVDTAQSDALLMRVPVSGGTPEPIASGQASTTALVIDDQFVYWTNEGNFFNGWAHDGSIARVATSGGAIETVSSGLDQPTGLIVDNHGIVWATPWQIYARSKP